MLIRYGWEMTFLCPAPTPMVCQLDIHPSLAVAVRTEMPFTSDPPVRSSLYADLFGNRSRRFVAPAGRLRIAAGGVIENDGRPDEVAPYAQEVPVADLPDDCMMYLVGSRYCETDRLSQIAWDRFGGVAPGWNRVQAICDFVHGHITFGYHFARSTRTAFEAYHERVGVCRDYAHLAITLCRCMNIPARYVNGHLGDIGVPPSPEPMDFSAWFEVWLSGRWYTFDARSNRPRIGRLLIARGRDAADVPLVNSFGPHVLESFRVWSDEVDATGAIVPWDAARS
ncbi:transglutaminase-like domain-containing protein [Pinisolibacter aquiterrae]|uniref:transglutaminase-like domain-containing protein n=1 Tax=Pinisolibacter aquiterrae TaxID=2815579 RepID=UPI001C3DBA1C|nr:transglutaminase family protein [Pinisolibacter aquiterrae]MBV5262499.1 transglutaminase family protein [Pinisolibacter aquiterrae]MCC8235866.1 transglutaminase family protein [Pinisolibacter aquiterrae]